MYEVTIAPLATVFLEARHYLTDSDRDRLVAGIRDELGRAALKFRSRRPHPSNPNLFFYDFGLMTDALEFRSFDFCCDSSGHVYGVVEVLHVDELPDKDASDTDTT